MVGFVVVVVFCVVVVAVVRASVVVDGASVVVFVLVAGSLVEVLLGLVHDGVLIDVDEIFASVLGNTVVVSSSVVVVGCVIVVVVASSLVVEISAIIFLYFSGSNSSMYAKLSGVVDGTVVVVVGVDVVGFVGVAVEDRVFRIVGVKSFPKVVFFSLIRLIISSRRNSKNPRVVAGVVGVFGLKVLLGSISEGGFSLIEGMTDSCGFAFPRFSLILGGRGGKVL